jgi:hypothetical protein
MTRDTTTPSLETTPGTRRVATGLLLAGLALLAVLAATPPADAAASDPTIQVESATLSPDDTSTVRVALSTAPEGVSGYLVRLTVADAAVARFEGASYPDRFALTTAPEIDEDGRTMTLEAADMEGTVEPGAEDVTLATVDLAGRSVGESAVEVEVVQFDDDSGGRVRPAVEESVVTVASGEGASGTDASGDGDAGANRMEAGDDDADARGTDAGSPGPGGPGPVLGLALVALVVAVLLGGLALRNR